jgi:hypothetical protein
VFAAIAQHITSEAFLSSAERSLNGRTGEISENVLPLESARLAAAQMLTVAKPDEQGLLNLQRFQDFFLSAVGMLTAQKGDEREAIPEKEEEIAEFGEFPDVRCALCRLDVKEVLYRHWTLERSLCSKCYRGETENDEYKCTAGLLEETRELVELQGFIALYSFEEFVIQVFNETARHLTMKRILELMVAGRRRAKEAASKEDGSGEDARRFSPLLLNDLLQVM